MITCIGCEWRLVSGEDGGDGISIDRYDRIESLYLTTGDFSALQQMNTAYPQQTRALIEDVLRIGQVNDPEINTKFLTYFQDSTLQQLVSEVELQYADMSDINTEFTRVFKKLEEVLPGIKAPSIYTQITSLDQSIVVGEGILGISLDKYLGENYWLYLRPEYGYTAHQRRQMTRQNIVPDCLSFYLMSLYPLPVDRELSQTDRDMHVGAIQWVVNRAMGRQFYSSLYVRKVNMFMGRNKNISAHVLLSIKDYSSF